MATAAAAEGEECCTEVELEVAAILCDLKRVLRARDRRLRRRMRRRGREVPEIPSWGRRRPRSMPEDKQQAPAALALADGSAAAERDGAASPDTPLAFPESGGDDAPAEAKAAAGARDHQWVQQQQHGVVASLSSQDNAHLLKQIEEYRARLQSSRSVDESSNQLPKVTQQPEPEPERKPPPQQQQQQQQQQVLVLVPVPPQRQGSAAPAALGLDLNEPARAADDDEARAAQAQAQAQAAAAAAAAEWYRQAQLRAALQKAAVTAGARRRRLEILRAKTGSPLLLSARTSRTRRAG